MRFFLLIILCLSLVSCGNKQLSQDELFDKFNKDWCECLEKQSEGKPPEEIVSQVTVNCILSIMLQYTQDKQLNDNMYALIAAKGYDDTLSDYEKEKLFGKELGENLMANAIDNCVTYRYGLKQFKKYYIEKAKQDASVDDKIEVEDLINNIQTELRTIDIDKANLSQKKQISYYYTVLGLLYEYTDRDTLAIENYDKAIQIDEANTNASGFKKLLVEYKND